MNSPITSGTKLAVTKSESCYKVLPADVVTNNDRMGRLKQEATAAAALNHPNIAHMYEIGDSAGTHSIAMEFVDGLTLRELIHGRQTDLAKLLRK